MQKVTLIFPDITSMAEFILNARVCRVIIDSSQKMLKGTLTDEQLKKACREFGAKVQEKTVLIKG